MSAKCPVCNANIPEPTEVLVNEGVRKSFPCPRCGIFTLDTNVLHPDVLRDKILKGDIVKIAKLSHWIRTRHESIRKEAPSNEAWRKAIMFDRELAESVLDRELAEAVIKNPRPFLAEQTDNLVRWIGDNVKVGGEYVLLKVMDVQAIVGSATPDEFMLVFRHLEDSRLIHRIPASGKGEKVLAKVTLTFSGWERYRELKRATSESRKAFMAMQYGEAELDAIVENVFRDAVKKTGFELSRLDDPDQPAGLIDDQLRVAIRTSRFLIADLTHENRGAYWEAGYAEGLGKPVIYTCEEKKFEELQTHFDTNHHLTILWDSKQPEKAAEKLKNTIRATLPAEAKLTDD